MAFRKFLCRRAILCRFLSLMLVGCGRESELTPIGSDERGLRELGEAYRDFTATTKRAPKSLKDMKVKGQRNPIAVSMITSGDLIVQWGSPLTREGETTDAILAYVKIVPAQGGNVLLQDGKTIKSMTAEEFKATPKAVSR